MNKKKSNITSFTRYYLSEKDIKKKLNHIEGINNYDYILVKGSQPTGFKNSSMYCVCYSMYAILLYILNYENLCRNITIPLAAKASRYSSEARQSIYHSSRPPSGELRPHGERKSKGKVPDSIRILYRLNLNESNFVGGFRKSRKRKKSKKRNFSKTLKKKINYNSYL